jgi:hypothetical protein
MKQKINLVFFDFKDSSVLVNELARFYKESARFDVEKLEDSNEVNQFLASSMNGIFFFKLNNKKELQTAVSILKVHRKLIKKGLIKPACISPIKNKKVETVLAKYGCVDILEPDTKAKTLTFKMDFWSKPILAILDKIEKENELKMKKSEAAESEKPQKEKEDFKYEGTLELQSDFWIVKHKNDCKKVLRRWLLRLLGPSPFIGSWVELEPQPGDKLPTWKYALKDSKNTDFIKDEGAWFFYGSKPEFDWKINRWSFSSDLPHLYFYTRDGVVHSRFKFENGQVVIKENSQFALLREEMILETCDAKYNFDSEKEEKEESESLEGDNNTDEFNNLSGRLDGEDQSDSDDVNKASTYQEEALGGNMSGKSSTDNLGGGPLSGKSFTDELGGDPLSGKSSTDNLGGGPLSGKVNPGEEKNEDKNKKPNSYQDEAIDTNMGGKSSTDELGGGPLSGKTSTDEYGKDPLSGKITPGELKDQKEKNNTFEEDALPGHMGGKSSTDDLGGDPLSGKVAPNVGKEKEDKNSTFDEEALAGHLGGKSSTDDLGGDPLSGKVAPNVGKEKENKNSTFDEEALAGHMGGKSSTDDLGGDPLSGKIAPNVGKEKEDKNSTFDEEALAGHMGGKSSTDDLGGDPLSGKVAPNVGKEKENKNSTFDEEALAGHMGGKSSTDDLAGGPLSGKVNPTNSKTPATPAFEELGDPQGAFGQKPIDPELGEPNFMDDPFSDVSAPDFSDGQTGELPGASSLNTTNSSSPAPIVNLDEMMNPNEPSKMGSDDDLYQSDAVKLKIAKDKSKFDKENQDGESPDDISGYQIMDGFDKEGNPVPVGMDKIIDGKPAVLESKKESSFDNAFDPEITNDSTADLNLDGKIAGQIVGLEESSNSKDGEKLDKKIGKAAIFDEKASLNIEQAVGKKVIATKTEKENEMLDALGGGLTDGDVILDGVPQISEDDKPSLDTQIGEANNIEDAGPDLETVIGQAVNLNLESGELKVVVKQQTEAGNDITFICDFEDFYEDELIVHAPKNSIPAGSEVRARVSLSYNGQKIKVDCLGKIEEIEDFSETKDTLVISLNNVSKENYEQFMELYQERQGSINEFMEMAKGY